MMCATLFLQSMSYFREFFVFLRQINSRIMTKLSVNINKIATLRNARGGNVPDVVKVALDCESFGADGITVHPRPDERHIRHSDVYALRPLLRTEFNIEGYPSPEHVKASFVDCVGERGLFAYRGTSQWTLLTTTVQQNYEMIWAGATSVEDGISQMKAAVEEYLN